MIIRRHKAAALAVVTAVVGLAVWAIVLGAGGAPASRPADSAPPGAASRVYDLRRALPPWRDQRLEGAMTDPVRIGADRWDEGGFFDGGSGGFFDEDERPKSADSAELTVKSVFSLLQFRVETLASDLGAKATVTRQGHLAVVRTDSPAVHRAVAELLASFEALYADTPTVAVHAQWVRLPAAEVERLWGPAGQAAGPRVLDDRARQAAEVLYECRAEGFDRQWFHAAAGKAQRYVISVDPVVAKKTVDMRPIIQTVLWGPVVEVRPMVAPDRQSVLLTVRSVLSQLEKNRTRPVPRAVANLRKPPASVDVDFPEFLLQSFTTAARIKPGRPVLLGGMTAPSDTGLTPRAGAAKARTLYLVVTVSVSSPRAKASKPARPRGQGGAR